MLLVRRGHDSCLPCPVAGGVDLVRCWTASTAVGRLGHHTQNNNVRGKTVRAASWVGETLDGSGSWALRARAPWLIGLLMLFDSWDSIVIAFTLPVISAEWSLSPLQSGWLISAGYGGQFLGAITFGSMAERYGRLPVLRLLVVVMSVLAVFCAMAGSYGQLISLRALQGLAIGGALPVSISY